MKYLKDIKGDRVIWIVVLILSIMSVLAVYSATGMMAYKKQHGNTEYYLMKQLLILGFAFLLMLVTHRVKYTYYSRIGQIAFWLSIALLIITFLFGANYNEAIRWFKIPGTNLTFQTSDIAKLALVMYLARLLSRHQDRVSEFKSGYLILMITVVMVSGLIFLFNFSTAAIVFVTSMVVMYVGRVKIRFLLITGLAGILMIAFTLAIVHEFPNLLPRGTTWVKRLENFSSKEKAEADVSYQADQAKMAIATGGVLGKSPGKSSLRYFLPHPDSDFIYAIIIEEYGLIGGIAVLLLYLILFYRVIRIATKCQGTFGTFMTLGLGFSMVFQALINMAVAVGLFPVTGQTLPMISTGGTSIWFTAISLGIILSVSRWMDTVQETPDGTAQQPEPIPVGS